MVGELAAMSRHISEDFTATQNATVLDWCYRKRSPELRRFGSSLVIVRDAPQNIRDFSRGIPGRTPWLAQARCRFFELRCACLRANPQSHQSQNLEIASVKVRIPAILFHSGQTVPGIPVRTPRADSLKHSRILSSLPPSELCDRLNRYSDRLTELLQQSPRSQLACRQ